MLIVVFFGVGVLLFGQRWLKLDFANDSVIRKRGLLFPVRSEVRRLGEFTAVVISFAPGDSDSPGQYPVRLRAATGKDFVMTKPTSIERGTETGGVFVALSASAVGRHNDRQRNSGQSREGRR